MRLANVLALALLVSSSLVLSEEQWTFLPQSKELVTGCSAEQVSAFRYLQHQLEPRPTRVLLLMEASNRCRPIEVFLRDPKNEVLPVVFGHINSLSFPRWNALVISLDGQRPTSVRWLRCDADSCRETPPEDAWTK